MKSYKFHLLNDDEAIGVTQARSLYHAASIFAERKRLVLSQFLCIFNVTEL